MTTRLLSAGAALFVGALAACAPRPAHLQLSEASSLVVPDSVGIAGVSLGPDGEILLWTPTQSRVVWVHGQTRRSLADARLMKPVGAAVLDRSMTAGAATVGTVEALDAAHGALLRFNRQGRLLRVRPIPSWAGAVQSLRVRTGWFALLPDSGAGPGWVVGFQADTAVRPRRRWVIRGHDGAGAGSVRLSAWGDSLIVTEVRSPFTSIVVPSIDAPVHSLTRPTAVPELVQTRYTWLSMPVLPLGRGFLQVFADAESDRRLFLTFDKDRRPVHASFVDAPIGIVAARTEPDRLLGMRRVGRTEVVQYRWEWTR